MPSVNKILLMPFSAQQMYDLINDIESYPKFLPWCKTTTIHSRDASRVEATLYIGKGLINQTITTINTMIPHQQINMQYKAGPFKSCEGSWQFNAVAEDTQCEVIFDINYEFSNMFTALTIEPIFNPITNTLIDAFYKRAVDIYGTD